MKHLIAVLGIVFLFTGCSHSKPMTEAKMNTLQVGNGQPLIEAIWGIPDGYSFNGADTETWIYKTGRKKFMNIEFQDKKITNWYMSTQNSFPVRKKDFREISSLNARE